MVLIIRARLVSQVPIDLGTVNGFVAAGRPTRPLRHTRRVIGIPDEKPAVGSLLLEVAL